MMQQHQRQQPFRLRLAGAEVDQQPGEPDGLVAEIGADIAHVRGGITLVEHQIEDGEHAFEPRRPVLRPRHFIGDAGLGDLVSGAHQPLRHGRLGIEEGVGHFLCLQPADGAQRQRHRRLSVDGGVAAGEDQFQPLVGDRLRLGPVGGMGIEIDQMGDLGGFGAETGGAPQPVDGLAAGGLHHPGRRRARQAVARPVMQGRFQRILQTVLGKLEIPDGADEMGEQPAAIGAHQRIDGGSDAGQDHQRSKTMIGRISTAPWAAPGMSAA